MELVSRRSLLRTALGTAAATAALATVFSDKNSIVVETKEGRFNLDLYGHGVDGLFSPSPVKETKINPNSKALFLEGFIDEEAIFKGYVEIPTNKNAEKERTTSPSFMEGAYLYSARHSIPIYYGDPRGIRSPGYLYALLAAPAAVEVGLIAGIDTFQKQLTRRNLFVKGAAAASTAFLATEPALYVAAILNPLLTQDWAKSVRELSSQSEELHRFEDYTLVFRNAQMGYKLLTLAERLKQETGQSGEITAILGQHRGVEYWLQQGKERCLQVMREFPRPFIEFVFGLPTQECAQRIASTLKLEFKRDPELNIRLLLYQDEAVYRALGGQGQIAEEKEIKVRKIIIDQELERNTPRGKEYF